MSDFDTEAERDLVDQIALVFENGGYPPVMARLLAFLMVCDPPEQSSAQLVEYLQASKGAISQATRMLMQTGLIERVRVRGSRSAWFRMREGAWLKVVREEVSRLERLREVAEAGLRKLEGGPEARKRRLQEFRDMNAFFETELPRLIERWEQQQRRES